LKHGRRLARLEAEVAEIRRNLAQVMMKQSRNLGLLAGAAAVLAGVSGWLAVLEFVMRK
jgi:hypothetical protein